VPFDHLAAVVALVEPLAHRFVDAGHRLYLVGGIVRDQWLDHDLSDSSDIDLTTDAEPAVIKDLVADLAEALWTQGERFGTIGLRFQGRAIEITTHRAESYTSDSRKPVVTFGDDIAVDLSRRDFTVNAMAIEVPSGELVDPWHGARDLEAQLLRTPLEPEISFTDDPLRMLRAARFASRFDLEPSDELTAAAVDLGERLRIVAIERIGDELERLFGLPDPERGLRFLVDTGLADELLTWKQPAAQPIESTRLHAAVDHTLRVSDHRWQIRLATLLAAALDSTDELETRLDQLRLSRDDHRLIVRVVTSARSIDPSERNAAALRRWFAGANHPAASVAVAVALADPPIADDIAGFGAAVINLDAAEDLANPELLDGETIMSLLGVGAGRTIGEAVAMLREAFFDEGPLPLATQTTLVKEWWADRGTDE
jgi:poly(A) polymerase